ncbi:MAG: hypothetical protein Q9219_005855 [cf. Caloplaca sp. 3 TL-2023]
MSAPTRKQGPMDVYVQERKSDPPPSYQQSTSQIQSGSKPSVQKSAYVSSLWEAAAAKSKRALPQEIVNADPSNILLNVCDEAKARQDESERKQWKVKKPGKSGEEVKLREVYGVIASCASRFRDVGDLVVQADPVHTALPWLVIRTCLTAAINEHEMYGIMIQGLEMVSGLVTHYVVIEQIFVIEDSAHARAVKNSLLALYTAVMDFLLEALSYFPPVRHEEDEKHWFRYKAASGAAKVKRAFHALDPTAQAAAKGLLDTISKAKANVDADANHAYATKNMEVLGEFGKGQDHIMKQLEMNGLNQEERDQRLSAILTEFHDPLYSMDDKVSILYDQMEKTQQHAETGHVLDWLSPAVEERRRKEYHKSLSNPGHRLKGSGRWLLEDPDYLQWQNSKSSSVACLSGVEGTGKTMLLSVVIDHLQGRISDNGEPDHLAFFYVSAQEGSFWANADEVIRSIVRQLSVTQAGTSLEALTKQKYDELTSATNEPSRPSMSECVEIAATLTNEFPITIIIDGLDGLQMNKATGKLQSSRNDLIESLNELVNKSSNPVKLLFSAFSDQPAEARLRRVFANAPTEEGGNTGDWHSIEVNATKNLEDVSNYVDKELTKRVSSGDLLEGEVDEDLKKAIKSRLLERSNGMFRYATMQIDRLCDDRMDRITVLEELDKPPPGITSFYDNSVNEIRTESIDRVRITAQNTLRWLLCIQEPLLPINAFLEAVSVEGGVDKPKESNLHSACRRLVKTDHYAGTLVFTYPSVREYLVTVPEYSESDCHLAAAERCLKMMIAASSSVSRLSATQVRFYWYAKLYWSLHYQKINFEDASDDKQLDEERQKAHTRVRELVRKFLMQGHKTSPAFNKWIAQIPDFVRELGEENALSKQLKSLQASLEDPLHVICVFGLAPIIEAHYKHLDFNQRNVHGQTALALAAENNQSETVKALIAHGRVDVNEFNVKAVHQLQEHDFSPIVCYASALQAAGLRGAKPIVETLVAHGARIGLVAGYYGSALQAACLAGHKELVDFLLTECNADPNSQGGYHGNSLQAAAAVGNLEVAERLLEAGACETANGGHYGSVLMAATCANSKEIIECLLAHTVDPEFLVNMRSEIYGTPLQKAADLDRIDIVDLLIANDANINALGGSGNQDGPPTSTSALAIAAWSGHNKIVSILCGLGAEVDLTHNGKDLHILHQAAIHNMVDLVKYCLDAGCSANLVTNKGPKYHDAQGGMTALSFASAEGHLEVVEMLLQNGGRIQFPQDGVTTLQLAVIKGHREVAKVLIEKHRNRHRDEPSLTLDFINRQIEKSGKTALVKAVNVGAPDIVSLLLDNGAAFIKQTDGVGPLHTAAWDGKPRIVSILLKHLGKLGGSELQTEINARNRWGKTPLIDAAGRNRGRACEILLAHGADYRILDNDSNSVLHYVSWRDYWEILKQFIDALSKADPETRGALLAAKNKAGNTALQEALFKRNFQTVRILIAAGAQISPSHRRDYFFRFATETGIEVLEQFIGALESQPEELIEFLNHRNHADGYSILHDAAEHNRPDMAELALEHGADPTTMDAEGGLDPSKVDVKTALHVAVWKGHQKIVDLLLSRALQDCDKARLARFINRRNSDGKTALMDAAQRDRPEMMKVLLEEPFNADWSVTDRWGFNVLHYCAFRGFRGCVDLLLRYTSGVGDNGKPGSSSQSPMSLKRFRAFINQQSADGGVSPLHDITGRGFRDLAMLLLETYGAEYEIYDVHGDSILHRAVQANHEDVLLKPYLEFIAKDVDKEKFKRVLTHKNKSTGRTVREACEVRGRKAWADLLKGYGG